MQSNSKKPLRLSNANTACSILQRPWSELLRTQTEART